MARKQWEYRRSELPMTAPLADSDLPDVTVAGLPVPQAKRVRSGLFGLCLLVFILLPLASVRCQNGLLVGTGTGLELVTGKTVQTQQGSARPQQGPARTQQNATTLPSDPVAAIVLGAIVIGLGAHLLPRVRQWLIAGVAGAVGVGALLVLKARWEDAVTIQSQGLARFDAEAGYWLSLVLLGLGAGLGLLGYWRLKAPPE